MSSVVVSETLADKNRTTTQPHGEPCPGCQRPLPIRARQAEEAIVQWECAACNSPVTGILLKNAAMSRATSVRLSQRHFDTTGVSPLPAALRRLVQEFCARREQNQSADERGQAVRLPRQLELTVIPLDEGWIPRGKPLLGIVVDFTARGLGMITTSRAEAPYAAVQLRHAGGLVQLLGKLAWSQDPHRGFHHGCVQFLLRFGRSENSDKRG